MDTFLLDTFLFVLAFVLTIVHTTIMAKQAGDAPNIHSGLFLLNALGLFVAGGIFIFISKTF